MVDSQSENSPVRPSYEHVGPTAKMVAYMRTFSDIPYSEQISSMTKSEEVVTKQYGDQREQFQKRAPVLEARFKAVSRLVDQVGSRNILELASGISPRGLIMTEDSAVTYVETDLPEMLHEKADLIRDVLGAQNVVRTNLHVMEVDAVNREQLQEAVNLTSGEITIAQEGLFVYMPRRDQEKVARNVLGILRDRGGAWITDVALKLEMTQHRDSKRKAMVSALQQEININLYKNAFADDAEVQSFFESTGFFIEDKVNLFDMKDFLVSPLRVSSDQNQLKAMLGTRFIYLLRAVKR